MNGALRQNQHRPSYVFAVTHLQEKEDSFCNLAAQHGQVMAFHGSKVENFYSILHNGFLGHLNKASLQQLREEWLQCLVCSTRPLIIHVSLRSMFTFLAGIDFTLWGRDLFQY